MFGYYLERNLHTKTVTNLDKKNSNAGDNKGCVNMWTMNNDKLSEDSGDENVSEDGEYNEDSGHMMTKWEQQR